MGTQETGRGLSLAGKIYVAGGKGMVGSAIIRNLAIRGHDFEPWDGVMIGDLRNQAKTFKIVEEVRPRYVFIAAGMVGGIKANSEMPVDFLYDNAMIAMNVIRAAAKSNVEKLCMLGSSCIYPAASPQPIPESALLTGPLEVTNRAYAVAKIAAIELCDAYRAQEARSFISVMPSNLYGPGDNYAEARSHVIPALIRRFHWAKVKGYESVTVWGTGRPLREFTYVDDAAEACVLAMERYDAPGPLNIGSGEELTIADLAAKVAKTVQFEGEICFSGHRDGVPRKLLDSTRVRALGWEPAVDLGLGLRLTYADFLSRYG